MYTPEDLECVQFDVHLLYVSRPHTHTHYSDFTSQKYDNTNIIVLEASLVTGDTFNRLRSDTLNVKGVLIVHLSNSSGIVHNVPRNYGSTRPFVSVVKTTTLHS